MKIRLIKNFNPASSPGTRIRKDPISVRQVVGQVYDLPDPLAEELIIWDKAVRVPDTEKPMVLPSELDPTPAHKYFDKPGWYYIHFDGKTITDVKPPDKKKKGRRVSRTWKG